MVYRSTLISLLVCLGLGGITPPAVSQVLIPRTVEPDAEQLEQRGLGLLKEAFQLAQFQQLEAALARAKLSTQLVPNVPQAWALLGSLYLAQNNIDDGIQALEKAVSLDNTNPGVYFSLGSAYFRQEAYAKAEKALKAGLKIKPDVSEALFDLGNTYYRLGAFKQAIGEYQKAVDLDQKFWPAINNIGLVQYEIGKVKDAIRSWEAAIEINDGESEPQLALASALYAQGKTDQGLALAAQALKLDSRYSEIEFLRENLWGDRLIADTKTVLATPVIQQTLSELDAQAVNPREQ